MMSIVKAKRGINRETIQSESTGQLLLVAITLDPNGFNRLASSIPMLPYPKINTYTIDSIHKTFIKDTNQR